MINNRRVDAIIIARGGSTRIPRKNMLDICGKPLVVWSIIQAKACKYVDQVWVSTDDDEIQEVSEQYGATVIRRPEWMMDNKYSGEVPFRHGLRYIRDRGEFDLLLQLLPTSPLRLPGDFDRMFDMYVSKPEPERPKTNAVSCKAMAYGIDKYIDLGDDRCEIEFIDKSGKVLIGAGGASVEDGIGRLDYYDWMQEHEGIIHDTDAVADEQFIRRDHTRVLEQRDLYYVEVKAWQIYELDSPTQIEMFRELFEYHIMQHGGEDYYG